MCVIIIDPAGKDLDLAILERAVDRNPHGWGLAAYVDGKIKVTKGFGIDGAKRAWKKHKGQKRVFHARVCTHGEKDLANCHPFDASYGDSERAFFHNGTVGIPRFNLQMSDSWHLAGFIRAFPSGELLNKGLSAYAQRERSRFVLFDGDAIWRYGEGWLERDGVYYSNASAIANIEEAKWEGQRRFVGGMLADKSVEVTSDTFFPGSSRDTKRGLYTNQDTELTYREHGLYHPNIYSYPGPLFKNGAWHRWDSVKGAYEIDPLRIGKSGASAGEDYDEYSKRIGVPKPKVTLPAKPQLSGLATAVLPATDRKNYAWGRKDAFDHLTEAPWMKCDIGKHGFIRSWPSANDEKTPFNYGDVRPSNGMGNLVTYRIMSPNSKKWKEIVFAAHGRPPTIKCDVDGPYPNGLIIESGNFIVTYAGMEIDLDFWQQVVMQRYYPEFVKETLNDDDELRQAFAAQLRKKYNVQA